VSPALGEVVVSLVVKAFFCALGGEGVSGSVFAGRSWSTLEACIWFFGPLHAALCSAGNNLREQLACTLPLSCRLLGAVSDAAHASMMNKLLDQYEQKDNLAQQLEGITKMEVGAALAAPSLLILVVMHVAACLCLCCTHTRARTRNHKLRLAIFCTSSCSRTHAGHRV
jgi:hypothetical protein